jgi:hypothetical protein
MKTVIFSHGDKGGVGKSTIAAVMVDRIVSQTHACTVIDGDVKTPDLFNRFGAVRDVKAYSMQINYAGAASTALNELAKLVEDAPSDFIVVNCPAGAGDTLDDLAGMFSESCEDLGVRMAASYALGTKDECAGSLRQSLSDGLMSFVAPENRLVIYPIFQGGKDLFPWTADPARNGYLQSRGMESDFPKLEPAFVMQALEKTTGYFSDAAKRTDIGLTTYARVSVKHWLKDAFQSVDPLLFSNAGMEDGHGRY